MPYPILDGVLEIRQRQNGAVKPISTKFLWGDLSIRAVLPGVSERRLSPCDETAGSRLIADWTS